MKDIQHANKAYKHANKAYRHAKKAYRHANLVEIKTIKFKENSKNVNIYPTIIVIDLFDHLVF